MDASLDACPRTGAKEILSELSPLILHRRLDVPCLLMGASQGACLTMGACLQQDAIKTSAGIDHHDYSKTSSIPYLQMMGAYLLTGASLGACLSMGASLGACLDANIMLDYVVANLRISEETCHIRRRMLREN